MSERISELGALNGGTYVCGNAAHWRTMERASTRDVLLRYHDSGPSVGRFLLISVELTLTMSSALRLLLALFVAVASGLRLPTRPVVLSGAAARPAAASSLSAPAQPAARATARRAPAPAMGLFGMGAPELAIIAGVALLVLGPDQVKKLAKDVGKVSAELKQVPEEFNKGMEVGKSELEAKKATTVEAPTETNKEEA